MSYLSIYMREPRLRHVLAFCWSLKFIGRETWSQARIFYKGYSIWDRLLRNVSVWGDSVFFLSSLIQYILTPASPFSTPPRSLPPCSPRSTLQKRTDLSGISTKPHTTRCKKPRHKPSYQGQLRQPCRRKRVLRTKESEIPSTPTVKSPTWTPNYVAIICMQRT